MLAGMMNLQPPTWLVKALVVALAIGLVLAVLLLSWRLQSIEYGGTKVLFGISTALTCVRGLIEVCIDAWLAS